MPKYNDLYKQLEKPLKPICVYALLDPEDLGGKIRYIGQTVQGFRRITEHWLKCHKVNPHTNCFSASKKWIKSLKEKDKIFNVVYLEYFENTDNLNEREQYWIQTIGLENLLNHELGGDRTYGISEFDRNIISKRTREAMNTPEIKNKCRENLKRQRELGLFPAVQWNDEHKQRISKQQDYWVWIIEDNHGNKLRGLKKAAEYFKCTLSAVNHYVSGRCKTLRGQTPKFYRLNDLWQVP